MKNLRLEEIYNLVESTRAKYGRFKKCEVHLHTPASHDYQLIKGKNYDKLSLNEIYELAIQIGYLSKGAIEELKNSESYYLGNKYIEDLRINTPYEDFKEYVTYGLLAHKLYKEHIEVVIIADHNTFGGYKKLKHAINQYYDERIKNVVKNGNGCISAFAGIEISCSDRHHLIAVIHEAHIEKFERYLAEILLSEEDGTYFDSRYLIETLCTKFDAITYLAHLNSSEYLGSGAYNSKLFGLKELKLIGTKDVSQIDNIKSRVEKYVGEKIDKFEFILEGDAHCIEDIGLKSSWIKFNDVNFGALKKAVENRSICIRVVKPNGVSRFIKGIVVDTGDKGFLKGQNPSENNIFLLSFSKDLNCIIGGRGSGKSTLLNILQTVLTQEVDNQKTLDFISNHKSIYCVFYLEGTDYILRFIPMKKDRDDYYYLDEDELYSGIKKAGNKISLSDAWVELYSIKKGIIEEVDKHKYSLILNKMFRRGYNINSLVAKINDNTISEFIRDTVTYGIKYNNIEEFEQKIKLAPKYSFAKTIRELMPNIIEYLENRRQEVLKHIEGFNVDNEGVIEIIYSEKEKEVEYYLSGILRAFSKNGHIENTYLTWGQAQRFIIDVVKTIGYLAFLNLLLNDQYKKIQSVRKIEDYIDMSDLSYYKVESELKSIDNTNILKVYRRIRDKIKGDREALEKSIMKCFQITDDFTIKFNINSKESVNDEPCIMKDIEEISLGQKVVALLTFVFNFGVSCNDNTPLLIDQPEDNLDNQYIYRNLVNSLKRIKSTRQVIIVTHSSTIVTNADAEQVIVMTSDNKNGWVKKVGYPAEKSIIRHIVNCLEGGQDSFKHKKDIYGLFIHDLK